MVHALKTCEVVEVSLHTLLTLAVDGGEWLTPRLSRFTPWKRGFSTRCVGVLVGLWTRRRIENSCCTYIRLFNISFAQLHYFSGKLVLANGKFTGSGC
jgi:hypothetical protein